MKKVGAYFPEDGAFREMQRLNANELIVKIKNADIFETLKHSKNYFSTDIASRTIAFISIPIFTRLFTQADYGIVAVFLAYSGIITVILSLNSYSAVNRYYYEKKADFGEFIGTTLIFISLIFIITIPIYTLFYKHIAGLMQLPGLLPVYLLFACLFTIICSIYYQILVPQKKSKEAAVISVLKGYATVGIAVLYILMYQEKTSMIGSNGRRVMLEKSNRENAAQKLLKLYAQLKKEKGLCVESPASLVEERENIDWYQARQYVLAGMDAYLHEFLPWYRSRNKGLQNYRLRRVIKKIAPKRLIEFAKAKMTD